MSVKFIIFDFCTITNYAQKSNKRQLINRIK
jgi:hypothetical protein